MIHIIEKDIIWNTKNAGIIFNPVSVSDTVVGRRVFNNLLKELHKDVYESYLDYVADEKEKKLLADVQLVKLKDNRVIMNGFVYKKDKIDLLSLTKCLVELFNLAEEYNVDIAIPMYMGCKNPFTRKYIETIINTVFEDCKTNVYVYKVTPYCLNKNKH